MGLDILCVALVATFLVLGLLSGFLSQIVRLAALVGAFLLAYEARAYTKPILVKWMNADSLAVDLLSLFLGWLACYILIVLIGTVIARIIKHSSGSIKLLDRVLGGALGSAKGFLIVYLTACALVLLREPIERHVPKKYIDLQGSRLAAFAGEHNLFSRIGVPYLEDLRELTSAFGDRSKRSELRKDPAIRELEQNRSFQRLLNDPSFRQAVEEKQLSAILNNPSLRAAMNDPQLRGLLSSLDLEKITKAVREIEGDRP